MIYYSIVEALFLALIVLSILLPFLLRRTIIRLVKKYESSFSVAYDSILFPSSTYIYVLTHSMPDIRGEIEDFDGNISTGDFLQFTVRVFLGGIFAHSIFALFAVILALLWPLLICYLVIIAIFTVAFKKKVNTHFTLVI